MARYFGNETAAERANPQGHELWLVTLVTSLKGMNYDSLLGYCLGFLGIPLKLITWDTRGIEV